MTRIRLFILLLVLLGSRLAQPLAGSDRPAVAALDSIGLTVNDIDRSVEFFASVLSFEKCPIRRSSGPGMSICRGYSACALELFA